MSAAVQLIKSLQETSSRDEKENLLRKSFERGDREFFTAAKLCLNPLVSFGVKKVAYIDSEYEPGLLQFTEFMELCANLQHRKLTGHAAIKAINDAAEKADVDEWNYFYHRVLLKDFKAGIDHSTINKVLKKINTPEALSYIIPVFQCQLAKASKDHQNKLVGPQYLDVKLDGVRLLTVIDTVSRTVSQYTRNGNPNTNFPHIVAEFEKIIDDLPASIVLDGEIVGKTFQELMKQLNRDENVDTADHKLALFDIVPLKDFLTGKSPITQRKRHQTLCGMIGLFQEKCPSVNVLPKVEVDLSTQEGWDRMEAFRNEVLEAAEQTADGAIIEGFMIKNPDAPYVCKKGTNWLKWKPSDTVDLTIVEVIEGKPDSKYVGMLGAIVCEGVDNGVSIRVNVGSGITDAQRQEFWDNRDKLLGQIVEIEFDEITKAEDSEHHSLRFPRFVRFRSIDMIAGIKD